MEPMSHHWAASLALAAALALSLTGCEYAATVDAPSTSADSELADPADPAGSAGSVDLADALVTSATVTRVIDGDTVELGTGDRLRLIGIDTPERGDCGADEATRALAAMVEGRQVSLVNPTQVQDRDAYDRLLAYLATPEFTDVGVELVRAGLAAPRYNSTDGHAAHPNEALYAATASTATTFSCAPVAEPPAVDPHPTPAAQPWVCSYSPTYDQNWHNDALCTNGVESLRPTLREWDSHVTEDELMESAREYATQLNG